jgi:hypothetical protein
MKSFVGPSIIYTLKTVGYYANFNKYVLNVKAVCLAYMPLLMISMAFGNWSSAPNIGAGTDLEPESI